VQVLVNLTYKNKKGEITATSQGDLFSIHGAKCVPDRPHPDGWARCLPSEDHCKGENEWNHYRVEANDGLIKLAVNGHVVSGVSKCNPRKGYLALESEGSECHFRNLKIKELPSTNPKKEEVAGEATGFKTLYTGLDLSGWMADGEAKKHWQPKDTVLHYDGKGKELQTEKSYEHREFVIDFRFPKEEAKPCTFAIREIKTGGVKLQLSPEGQFTLKFGGRAGEPGGKVSGESKALNPKGQWNRLRATVDGNNIQLTVNGKVLQEGGLAGEPEEGVFGLHPEGEMDFANLFVRELK
jgi:hypothetical protein